MNITSHPPSAEGLITPPPDSSRARTVPLGGAGPRESSTDAEPMRITPPSRRSLTERMVRF